MYIDADIDSARLEEIQIGIELSSLSFSSSMESRLHQRKCNARVHAVRRKSGAHGSNPPTDKHSRFLQTYRSPTPPYPQIPSTAQPILAAQISLRVWSLPKARGGTDQCALAFVSPWRRHTHTAPAPGSKARATAHLAHRTSSQRRSQLTSCIRQGPRGSHLGP